MIGGNFRLTMQEIHEMINGINDLRKSLEFRQNSLEEKVGNVAERMEKLDSDIQELYEYQMKTRSMSRIN